MSSISSWKNPLYFIFSAIGAAVGLGNIWKFPYIIGTNGGGYFLLAYLISLIFCIMPILLAELAIGRFCRRTSIDSFLYLSKKFSIAPFWQLIAWLGLITGFLILSFYIIVSGWSLYYLVIAFLGKLDSITMMESLKLWENFLANPYLIILFNSLFLALTAYFTIKGVNNGLGRLNIIAIPLLFFSLSALIIYIGFHDNNNFMKAINYIFSFQQTEIKLSQIILSALGQGFFSLAVGIGAMIIYGAYLDKKTNLLYSAVIISLCQLIIGLFAAIAIFSIVFKVDNGSSSEVSGPGLMFVAIPAIIAKADYASLINVTFFTSLFIAALTSSVNIAELLIVTVKEQIKISRKSATLLVSLFVWLTSSLLSLSFNLLNNLLIDGKNLFELIILISSDYLLVIGGSLIAIYTGWVLPNYLDMGKLINQNHFISKLWVFLLKYISSITPIIIMIF